MTTTAFLANDVTHMNFCNAVPLFFAGNFCFAIVKQTCYLREWSSVPKYNSFLQDIFNITSLMISNIAFSLQELSTISIKYVLRWIIFVSEVSIIMFFVILLLFGRNIIKRNRRRYNFHQSPINKYQPNRK